MTTITNQKFICRNSITGRWFTKGVGFETQFPSLASELIAPEVAVLRATYFNVEKFPVADWSIGHISRL